MTYKTFDGTLGIIRDCTPAEILEIDSRKTFPPTEEEYTTAIQDMLDAKAQERRYDSLLSASTYLNSHKSKFKAEATALVSWRDDVWDLSYTLMDQVKAGTLPQPTIDELLAMLPTFEWPA